jgi:hypothetical protein
MQPPPLPLMMSEKSALFSTSDLINTFFSSGSTSLAKTHHVHV